MSIFISMSIEDFQNPLEKETKGIESVESFESLYKVIRNTGEIKGTLKNYTPDEVIKVIERVRHGHRSIEFVTRSYGIRDAVERLLENDKLYQKYTKGSRAKK